MWYVLQSLNPDDTLAAFENGVVEVPKEEWSH